MSVLDLSTLAFKVETDQLKLAKERLDAVAAAVKNLAAANRSADTANRAADKAAERATKALESQAKVQAKVAIDAAKIVEAEAKASIQNAKAQTEEIKTKTAKIKLSKEELALSEQQKKADDELTKAAEKVAAAQAKAADAQAKAAQKAADAQAKAAEKAKAEAQALEVQAQKAAADADRRAQDTINRNARLIEAERLKNEFMTKGLSSGESATMAKARMQGLGQAQEDVLEGTLRFRRELKGPEPFDNSLSGMDKLILVNRELSEAIKQVNNQTGLTLKQSQELSRDKARSNARETANGKSQQEIVKILEQEEQSYIKQAALVNQNTAVLKEKQRVQRESANAARAVINEEQRMESVIKTLTQSEKDHLSVTEKQAIAYSNYARNLERSGVSAEVAEGKLKKYREGQKIVQQVEEERQANYLRRGLQPQIGDVAVSLAAGQNPLTVLLQQGDQIRGLISQTQISGEALKKVMREAMSETVKSIGQTAAAMGSVLGGAITNTTKAILTIAGAPITLLTGGFRTTGVAAEVAAANIERLEKAAQLLSKAGIVAVVAAIGTALYQMYQSVKQHDDLVKSITLTGGAFGMTASAAADYAKTLNSAGETTSKVITVIAAMAKEGGFVRNEIALVTESALNLEKYGGVAIADTVKAFSKLKDDPVKALGELAKATGELSPAMLQSVIDLEQMGRKADAVALAMKLMADTNANSVERIKGDLSGFSLWMIEMGQGFRNLMDDIFGFVYRNASPAELLRKELRALDAEIEKASSDKIQKKFGTVRTGKGSLGFEDAKKYRQELYNQLEVQENLVKAATEERAANSKAAGEVLSYNARIEKSYDKKIKLAAELARIEAEANTVKAMDAKRAKGSNAVFDQAKHDALIAATKKQYEDKPTKAQTEAQKQLENDIKRRIDLQNAIRGENAAYDENEAALERQVKLGAAKGGIDKEEHALLLKKLKETQPGYLKQLAEEKAYTEGLNKVNEERAKNMQKIAEYNNATRDENLRLDYRLEVLGKTEEQVKALNRERDKELKLAKARDDYDKQILANKQVSSRPNAENAAALKAYEDKVKAINREIAVSAAEDLRKEYDAVMSPIADSIAKALMVGGEEGANMIRKQIEDALLREPFQILVNALVKDATGVGGGNGVNLTNALEKIGESYSKFSSLGGMGLFTDLGGTIGKYIASAGNTFFSTGFSMFNKGSETFGKLLMSTGTEIGSLANTINKYSGAINTAGEVLGYVNAAMLAAQGKWGAAIGSAIGSALGGGVGSFIGEKLGTFVDNLFGGGSSYMKSMGTSGQFSSTGFSGGNYTINREEPNKVNSWFGESGKDVKSMSAMPQAVKDQLSSMYISTLNSAALLGGSMGLNMSWLKDFKQNIDITTLDAPQSERYNKNKEILASSSSTFEEKQKAEQEIADIDKTVKAKYDAIFDTIRNKIATLTVSPQFIRQGEQAADALARMSSALISVNNVMQNLGYSLYDVSQNGADAASRLQEAFGGSEAFGQQMSDFYTGYYTPEEQKANALIAAQAQFSQLGINKTTAELANFTTADIRKIVEEAAKGRGTIAGDNTFAATVALANAFRPLISASEDVTNNFKELSKSLEEEVARIRGDILGTGPEAQANAQTAFTIATAQARAGDAEAAANLPELSKNLLKFAENNASTLQELNQIRAATANSLAATAAIVKSFGIAPVTTGTTVGSSTGGTTAPTNPVIGAPVYNPSTDLSSPLFVGPRPLVASNATTGNYGDNGNTEVLIALEAVASMTNKNYKLLDGVINGENNLRVSVYAP